MRRDSEPSIPRRCSQLKQKIRQAKCEHPEHSLRLLFLANEDYIEYCVDCSRVTIPPGVNHPKDISWEQLIKCEHLESDSKFLILESDGWVEFCTSCERIINLWEP